VYNADRQRYYCDGCGTDITAENEGAAFPGTHFCNEVCEERHRTAPPLGAAAALCQISQFKSFVSDRLLTTREALADMVALCEDADANY